MTRFNPRRIVATILAGAALSATLLTPVAHAGQVTMDVSGSTQMYTLGALLGNRYQYGRTDLQINVTPTSSQFGFDNTCNGGTDVGMSDVYIQDSQLTEMNCGDMINIPVAISATPVVYNLPGKYFNQRKSDGFTLVHPVRLTPRVIAGIYLGTVTKWNDPAIASLNHGMTLPNQRIEPFNSSEPGGSGFVFDQWLALTDPRWKSSVGVSLTPAWPAGSVAENGSGAMVQAIKSTPYSIGFAGFDYAIDNHMQAAALKNAAGVFLTPSLNGLSYAINKAIQNRMIPIDFRASFVNVADPRAFNPACFEFFVVHQNLAHGQGNKLPAVRQAIKDFLEWDISPGGGQKFIESIQFRKVAHGTAAELRHGFIPVPHALYNAIKAKVDGIAIQ